MSEKIRVEPVDDFGPVDEITLRDIVKTIYSVALLIRKKLGIIAALALAGAVLGWFVASRAADRYSTTVTFVVNEDEGLSGGGIGSILAAVGFGSAGGQVSEANPLKILQIARSNVVLFPALISSYTIEGKDEFLINHVLDAYDLVQVWSEDFDGLNNDFTFRTTDITQLTPVETYVYQQVSNLLNESGGSDDLLQVNFDTDTGIMVLGSSSIKPELSFGLVNLIYQKLSIYYVSNAVEPNRVAYNNLVTKVDSLKTQIENTAASLARLEDSQRGTILARSRLKQQELNRNLQITTIGYGKAIEQLEIAEFSLNTQTPYFQIINTPMLSVKPNRPRVLIYIVVAATIAAILGSLAVVFFYVVKASIA